MTSSKMKRRGDCVCHLRAKMTLEQDYDCKDEDGWSVSKSLIDDDDV